MPAIQMMTGLIRQPWLARMITSTVSISMLPVTDTP